jgi:Polyketide cyclase / dehydrase and lipid transport
MQLKTRAVIEIPKPIEQVYDFSVATSSFPRALHKVGPIPGILAIEMLGGAVPAAGARRKVTMTDGSTIDEEILALERPFRHRYRWLNKPKFPFSLMVRWGEGDWTFTAASGGGTRIEWVYRFQLTTPLLAPMTALTLLLFRRWMQKGLGRIKTILTDQR